MNIGSLRHSVTLENPSAAVADGDGGYTQAWTSLTPPRMWASVVPATARDLENVAASTVISTATHVLTMRYHQGVTTKTRITFGTRVFHVTGVANVEERGVEMVLTCVEVVA